VFDWPADGKLVVPGLRNPVKRAQLLGSGTTITAERTGGGVVLSLPGEAPNRIASVIALEFDGRLEVSKIP
jgi:alpha-L-fucosidase